jgi:hypothetical protein
MKKRLIKAYSYQDYEIKNENGHYAIYDKEGNVVETCDTYEEAQEEINNGITANVKKADKHWIIEIDATKMLETGCSLCDACTEFYTCDNMGTFEECPVGKYNK